MSFRCGKCGEAQPAGTKPAFVITKTRSKEYFNRHGKRSFGTEIVEEQLRCSNCPATVLDIAISK